MTNPPASEASSLLPHQEFITIRNRLLDLEALQKSGGKADTSEVQTLTRRAAELIAIIQTSTTGPKKPKLSAEDKPAKPAKASKPSRLTNITLPTSFDDL